MAKTIIGLDIGTWSVKTLEIDPRDGSILGFHEVLLPAAPVPVTPPPSPAAAAEAAGQADDSFEDSPTEVREAPSDAPVDSSSPPTDAAPAEAGDAVEPVETQGDAVDLAPWRAAVEALPDLDAVLTAERLIAAMPEELTTTLRVPVPFDDLGKVRSVLPHLLEDRLPMPLESVIWAFHIVPSVGPVEPGEEEFEAIVGVASREDIGAHLAMLGEAGLDPSMLLVPELGLIAMHQTAWRAADGSVAILDLGHETSKLLVVHEGVPAIARSMKTGGRKLTSRIADIFGVDEAEAERIKHEYAAVVEGTAPNDQMARMSEAVSEGLRPVVRDVRRTLQSAFARDRVEVSRVFIVGGTSVIPGLDKYLALQLGIPVERLLPDGLTSAGDAAPRAAMAWSLAHVGYDEKMRGEAINLRKGPFVYRGRSSYLRVQLLKFAAAAAVLLMLVVVLLMAQKASHEAQRDAMRDALSTQTQQLFGESVTRENQIKMRLEGEGGGAGTLIPTRSAYEITYEVVNRVSSDLDLDLTRLEVDVDRNLIQIRGDTSDVQAVDKLVTDLEKLECLKEIKKDKLTVKGDKADFELQINSGC